MDAQLLQVVHQMHQLNQVMDRLESALDQLVPEPAAAPVAGA